MSEPTAFTYWSSSDDGEMQTIEVAYQALARLVPDARLRVARYLLARVEDDCEARP